MLRSGVLLPRFERVVLVNCARLNAHLAYQDELQSICVHSGDRVQYLPFVTREPPSAGHHAGRITSAIEDGRLEQLAATPFDAARSHFMLCGNPEMISEAMQKLAARGLKRHRRREPGHITIEKYW
jgi:ferredoxin--NADP+ reductase